MQFAYMALLKESTSIVDEKGSALHLCMLLYKLLELLLACTNELINLLAVLVEAESRHGADALCAGDVGELININLQERHASELLRELLHEGSNLLAGTAPLREEINYNELAGSVALGLPVSVGGNVLYHLCGCVL